MRNLFAIAKFLFFILTRRGTASLPLVRTAVTETATVNASANWSNTFQLQECGWGGVEMGDLAGVVSKILRFAMRR